MGKIKDNNRLLNNWVKLFSILDVIVIVTVILLFVFNDDLISKLTDKKLYLTYALFGEKKVNSQQMVYQFSQEYINNSDINKSIKEENKYEKMILTKDAGNDNYKVIKTKIKKYNAYLVVIYDPSKVHVLLSDLLDGNGYRLQTVKELANKYHAEVAINGGRFSEQNGRPIGYVISNGKFISKAYNNKKGNLIAFDKDNRMRLVRCNGEEALAMGIRDAVEFGPFLIVDGKPQKMRYLVSGYHRVGRTIIAQRQDGIVLFLVTDPENLNTSAPNMDELIDKLLEYGAYNAANLDGGASCQIVVDNKLLNQPRNMYNKLIPRGRFVVNGWGLVDE